MCVCVKAKAIVFVVVSVDGRANESTAGVRVRAMTTELNWWWWW